MFARIKTSGRYQYLQLVVNRKEQGKTKQHVIATLGRLDQLQAKGDIETIIRSLAKFSESSLLILSGKSEAGAHAVSIGPALIFDRLWNELGLPQIIGELLDERKFEFDVERTIFLTVLHRLFCSGSDRSCDRWRHDYAISGVDDISLHHQYRAMAFLGEALDEQDGATPFSPRCNKDLIEETLFERHRDLFTGLDLVFFDTTSIYFEGAGGKTTGRFGHTKDNRPDLHQMVVGALLDNNGRPICSEMWPGNTTDVKTLLPVVARLQGRFNIKKFCIVADRGMISAETIAKLEHPDVNMSYIFGVRMRKLKEVRCEVFADTAPYQEVYPESDLLKDPSPLAVKEVVIEGRRYILCQNSRQARKDRATREKMIADLTERIKSNPKGLIGNSGYARYLKVNTGSMSINQDKIEEEAQFDGKWVLRTNMKELSAEEVALKYKELWQVEQVFRDIKSVFETRPVFHKQDETIRGHVFCSFLALILRKELDQRLEQTGLQFEWEDIKHDLKALQEITVEESGRTLAIRTTSVGTCGKVFQAVRVAMPPSIRTV